MEEKLKAYQELFYWKKFKTIFHKNIETALNDEQNNPTYCALIRQYIKTSTSGNIKDKTAFLAFLKAEFLRKLDLYALEDGYTAEFLLGGIEVQQHPEILDYIIPFTNLEKLSIRDKFEIVLYKRKNLNGMGYDTAFSDLKKKYPYTKVSCTKTFFSDSNCRYEYTARDVELMYSSELPMLSFDDKVNIVIQRLYAELYGLGCIDALAYSDVNEVGISDNGRYIYCWADDKIYLSFFSLTEKQTAIIQDRSIAFDEKAGQLDMSNSEVLCYRADNARITATCPPYTSARNLCIRIFNKRGFQFQEVVPDGKQQLLTQTLVRTGMKLSLQGSLGSGKTTAMQTFLELLDDRLHVGTVEDTFEQHNLQKYQNKRIVELQAVEGKSILDAVMSMLRLSVDIASVGEARDGDAVFAFIQLAQALDTSTMMTSHIAAPEDTVGRYKNMLVAAGKYYTEQSAIADVIQYVNFVFQHNIVDGKRRITDIVEIVPLIGKSSVLDLNRQNKETLEKLAYLRQIQTDASYMYQLNPVLVFEDGKFRFKNFPSIRTVKKARYSPEAWKLMQQLLKEIAAELGYEYPYRKEVSL